MDSGQTKNIKTSDKWHKRAERETNVRESLWFSATGDVECEIKMWSRFKWLWMGGGGAVVCVSSLGDRQSQQLYEQGVGQVLQILPEKKKITYAHEISTKKTKQKKPPI